jgi:RimJ/RimL family protein N-acetyltransferase
VRRPDRPAERIEAGPVVLRRYRPADSPALVAAVNESLDHLAPWMPWAQEPATALRMGDFIVTAVRDFEAATSFGYAMMEHRPEGERLVGGCGLHRRVGPDAIEIGYWVHVDHVRRGIARAAAVRLRDEGFAIGCSRVEIHCDEQNRPSAAVARSAGFTLVANRSRAPRTPAESGRELIFAVSAPGA